MTSLTLPIEDAARIPYKPIVAAAVIEGEIVSLAHTFAWAVYIPS